MQAGMFLALSAGEQGFFATLSISYKRVYAIHMYL